MSTPSMLLLCGGAAASLAGVWALAGLSERSSQRATPRALVATGVGLVAAAAVYLRAPVELRGGLSLPTLFGAASVLALGAGAAKLDAALAERDGARAVRRAAGLIGGTFLAMAAVAAVSLELLATSLLHARFGWVQMLPVVASALVVFAQRGRLAGAGGLALGRRGLFVGLAGSVLLVGARFAVTPAAAGPVSPARVVLPRSEPAKVIEAPAEPSSAPPAPPEASASRVPSASSAPSAAPLAAGAPGELQIEAVASRGLLEADVRGGVTRRFERLQACLAEPKNQQSGALSLKIGIDASGSVGYVRATGGDLLGTPLAACLLPAFYKMGFAAPGSSNASFDITLRSPPR